MRKAANGTAKDRLSHCKRPCFATQKTAFCNALNHRRLYNISQTTKKKDMNNSLSILKAAAVCALMAAVPTLTSCSDDDEAGGGETGTQAALTVSVAEGDGTAALEEGTQVGIIAVTASDTTACTATATASAAQPLAGIEALTAAMHDGMQMAAYSPAALWTADTYGEPVQFGVQTDQSTEAGYRASDLMMSPLTTVAGGRVALVMEHKMAKLTVHITDVTGNYDLTTACLAMPSRLTTVTADIEQGTVTTVDGVKADITPYSPSNNAYRASASAIVAPAQAEAGEPLVSVTIDGETFDYSLTEAAAFEAGKEYVYSMRLTSEGLVPYGSYVTAWGDDGEDLTGDAEEMLVYGVGDYITSHGTFIKADRLTADNAKDVIAVVFSTQVSEGDAAEGYNAYAMGVERVTGVKFGFADAVNPSVDDWASALNDLDGYWKTAQMWTSDAYQAIADKQGTAFQAISDYSTRHPIDASVTSGWFMPSIGQMLQILNNLGQAGLTADTEVNISQNNSSIYTSDDASVLERVNAPVEALGLEPTFPTTGSIIYMTSSEYTTSTYNNFWCIQTAESGGSWHWGFGKNAGRGSSNGRSLVPCVAVKLPEAL